MPSPNEGFKILGDHSDRVQDANVVELPTIAQLVHGSRADAETFGDLADGEQRWLRSPVW